jgi:DNA modification methylase
MSVRILVGDNRARLRELPDQSVQMCVTSPPYFGLRDYGHDGQIGLEATPDAFVAELVGVFREVKRVLRDDGTLWLNLGDSYTGAANSGGANKNDGGPAYRVGNLPPKQGNGLKSKDLIGIPWRVAFALQADGWYLRSDIIWHKPNPMPESVTDRPTKSHEYIFLLTKSEWYYYDAAAVAEPAQDGAKAFNGSPTYADGDRNDAGRRDKNAIETRNKRSVWTVSTSPYKGAHFATFPPALIEPCIKAGSREGDVVLDPFGGAGTTGLVADRLGRSSVLCELNPTYAKMAADRITQDNPMFTQVNVE